MALTVLVHLSGEDPVVGEVEELPTPSDVTITLNNPRRRDGKDLSYVESNVVQVLWPMHRINFIEVMPTAEEERLIGPVRE
jgi:hypothetical protein